ECREGVEKHFCSDAKAAIQRERSLGNGNQHSKNRDLPGVKERFDGSQGLRAAEKDKRNEPASSVSILELLAVKTIRLCETIRFLLAENRRGAVSLSRLTKRQTVHPDAESQDFVAADRLHDSVLPLKIRLTN